MTSSALNQSVKIDHWETLKSLYSTVKEIAETVRKDCRRKKPKLASLIVARPIKKVIQPLSLGKPKCTQLTVDLWKSKREASIKRYLGAYYEAH